jgi:drug/metabolite transporter (DMT)-like permease
MRFLSLYLVGYFLLLIGAVWALWEAGILNQIPGVWLGIGALIALGLGIMLAVASSKPDTTITRT